MRFLIGVQEKQVDSLPVKTGISRWSAGLLSGRVPAIFIDFDIYQSSVNAMTTEPWVTAEDVARHWGVAKDSHGE